MSVFTDQTVSLHEISNLETPQQFLNKYSTAFVTVGSFGAVGDGVTDDSASIQLAINKAGGKVVYFATTPNGYNVSTGLILPNNTVLMGDTDRINNGLPDSTGVLIKTNNAITILSSASVLSGGDTYGIKILNISLRGNGQFSPIGTTAFVLGFANIANLCYLCEISRMTVSACNNGGLINRCAVTNRIERAFFFGIDGPGSIGLQFFLSQGCTVNDVSISDYATPCAISGTGIYCKNVSFNWAVGSDTSPVNLLYLNQAFHNTFDECTFENLSTTATTVNEVLIEEITGDTFHSTNNAFTNCTWNGITSSASHVKLGRAANPAVTDTLFNNCTFSTVPVTNIALTSCVSTTFIQSYRATNYDGTQTARPTTSGTDSSLRFIDVNGIQFPSTQVASANPNTLDDYAELAWTPAITFGGASVGVTYGVQVGTSTKIGRQVFVYAHIALTSKGSSVGSAIINGLPVVPLNVSICTSKFDAMSATTAQPASAAINAGASGFLVLTYNAAGNYALAADTNFTNTSDIIISAVYTV